jgi:hypothetical protein
MFLTDSLTVFPKPIFTLNQVQITMENQTTLPAEQTNAHDLLTIVELEDRLELASAAEEGRCHRCNGNDYPDTVIL